MRIHVALSEKGELSTRQQERKECLRVWKYALCMHVCLNIPAVCMYCMCCLSCFFIQFLSITASLLYRKLHHPTWQIRADTEINKKKKRERRRSTTNTYSQDNVHAVKGHIWKAKLQQHILYIASHYMHSCAQTCTLCVCEHTDYYAQNKHVLSLSLPSASLFAKMTIIKWQKDVGVCCGQTLEFPKHSFT